MAVAATARHQRAPQQVSWALMSAAGAPAPLLWHQRSGKVPTFFAGAAAFFSWSRWALQQQQRALSSHQAHCTRKHGLQERQWQQRLRRWPCRARVCEVKPPFALMCTRQVRRPMRARGVTSEIAGVFSLFSPPRHVISVLIIYCATLFFADVIFTSGRRHRKRAGTANKRKQAATRRQNGQPTAADNGPLFVPIPRLHERSATKKIKRAIQSKMHHRKAHGGVVRVQEAPAVVSRVAGACVEQRSQA